MSPGEVARRIAELERDYETLSNRVSERHGQLVEKLSGIDTSLARHGERLGSMERSSTATQGALTKYIDEQRADKRSIRNIVIGAVAGVLLEGVILVYVLASRAGVN